MTTVTPEQVMKGHFRLKKWDDPDGYRHIEITREDFVVVQQLEDGNYLVEWPPVEIKERKAGDAN